jgi:hypothetical protein
MRTKILVIIAILLAVPIWADDDIDKLENFYIEKALQLQVTKNSDIAGIEKKYNDDSRKLAEYYVKSLKKIEVATVQKGDLDGALKVRAKIKEIQDALDDNSKTSLTPKVTTNVTPPTETVVVKPRQVVITQAVKEKNLGYKLKRHPIGAKLGPDGHYYKFVNEKVPWSNALNKSIEAGGYLAVITSKDELDWIINFTKTENRGDYIWLGGHLVGSKPIWLTGEVGDDLRVHPRVYGKALALFGKELLGNTGTGRNSANTAWLVGGYVIEWDR